MKIHTRENTKENQKHLDNFRKAFTKDAAHILLLLIMRKQLTVRTAMAACITGDLRRRIKDIRDFGIDVSDKWVTTSLSRRYKVYFMTDKQVVKAIRKANKRK